MCLHRARQADQLLFIAVPQWKICIFVMSVSLSSDGWIALAAAASHMHMLLQLTACPSRNEPTGGHHLLAKRTAGPHTKLLAPPRQAHLRLQPALVVLLLRYSKRTGSQTALASANVRWAYQHGCCRQRGSCWHVPGSAPITMPQLTAAGGSSRQHSSL